MQNTIKISTIIWVVAAFAFSPLSPIPSYNLYETVVRVIGGVIFAYLGYLTYRQAGASRLPSPPTYATDTKLSAAYLSSLPPVKAGAIGAGLGFAVGYLTRPEVLNPNTFSRQKAPLSILFMDVSRGYSSLKADMLSHMVLATVIGAVVAVVLVRVLASRKAPDSERP